MTYRFGNSNDFIIGFSFINHPHDTNHLRINEDICSTLTLQITRISKSHIFTVGLWYEAIVMRVMDCTEKKEHGRVSTIRYLCPASIWPCFKLEFRWWRWQTKERIHHKGRNAMDFWQRFLFCLLFFPLIIMRFVRFKFKKWIINDAISDNKF